MEVQKLTDLNPVLTNENSVSDLKIEKNEETTIAQRALALGSRFTLRAVRPRPSGRGYKAQIGCFLRKTKKAADFNYLGLD